MTQTELAKRVGCSWQHLSDVKRGVKGLSWSLAEALERETGISACVWMRAEKEKENPWELLKALP